MTTKVRVLQCYSDPGHGWAKVKRSHLYHLGIAEQISRYSYQRGDYVYLEEDADLTLYVETLKARGYTVKARQVSNCASSQSHIRNYDHYVPGWPAP